MQRYPSIYRPRYGGRMNLMKLTLFLICFSTLSTLSAQHDQKVTVVGNGISLSEVFRRIESQTEYSFAFVNSQFDASRKVNISARNRDLNEVLKEVLADTGHTYSFKKERIFLLPIKENKKEKELVQVKKVREKTVITPQEQTGEEKHCDVPQIALKKTHAIVPVRPTLNDSLDTNKAIGILNDLADLGVSQAKTPLMGIKSNLLLDLTGSIALGAEIKMGQRYSVDLSMSYNPWEFNVNKNIKHILIQPEIRYWLCEPFNGHFFGLHGLYAHFNLSGVPVSDYMKSSRLQGDLYGVGVSYGYQWLLSKRWSLEATAGVGYMHTSYDRYACKSCKQYLGSESKHYFAPTKASFSLIYFIK